MSQESFPQPPDPLAGRPEFLEEDAPSRWDDLPPVEPPSAGFIVQLFVVPAIIVAVIVGVYLLFGRLASGELDWRKQLTDVRSENPHLRWRGALGLAQMLQADTAADGQRLAENRDVAEELAVLLNESIARASAGEEDLKQQEFLARTLGLVDVDDITVPALKAALQPGEDGNVRKNAIASLATIANRRRQQGGRFDDAPVIDDVVDATSEQEAMLRHVATYALGLFASSSANDRLVVLLDHPDPMTQVNAAVGLARQGSVAGMEVFAGVLSDAQSAPDRRIEAPPADEDAMSAEVFEEALILSNTLRALSELHGELTAAQIREIAGRLEPIADAYPQPELRVQARQLLTLLED